MYRNHHHTHTHTHTETSGAGNKALTVKHKLTGLPKIQARHHVTVSPQVSPILGFLLSHPHRRLFTDSSAVCAQYSHYYYTTMQECPVHRFSHSSVCSVFSLLGGPAAPRCTICSWICNIWKQDVHLMSALGYYY